MRLIDLLWIGKKASSIFLANLVILVTKCFSWKRIKFKLVYADCIPKIVLRGKGKLYLGRISFRCRFSLLVGGGGEIVVGDNCFFNNDCSINSMESIRIGKGSIFGEGVKIYDHDHVFESGGRVEKEKFKTSPITIGDDCWIGSACVILKGVKICDNVIIGAGSVVAKSIDRPGVYVNKGLAKIEKVR